MNKEITPVGTAEMSINGKPGQFVEGRRDHRRGPVPGAVPDVRGRALRVHPDRRRPLAGRHPVGRLHGAVRAGPLPQAVPPEVRRRGQGDRDGEGGRHGRLDRPAQVQEQLRAQPRVPGPDAVADGHADQHADLVARAEPVLLAASTPRATSFRTSTSSSSPLAENLEVANLRAIAGEYDEMGRHMDMPKLPVFLENQQKGNYKVVLDLETEVGRRSASTSTRATRPTPRSASGSPTSTSAGRSRWGSTATSSTRRSSSGWARPAR